MKFKALHLSAMLIALILATAASADDQTQQTAADAVVQNDVAELEPLPVSRSARWAPMLVSYQRMNLLHPTLYYRSIQERREFPDAIARGCCGRTCSAVYEIVQFPVQLALSPLLVLMNLPWQLEQARP